MLARWVRCRGMRRRGLTLMLGPRVLRSKHDRYSVCVPHDKVVRPGSDDVPVLLEQFMGEEMLAPTDDMACRP
jgi:hypothetical protein